ncbi:hypothetical protein LOTGIDRAFT_154176 [Lottia gigantea]|uniref:Uncharacterized protein n=1 Tax=Lottia gigantea TaxID=225164 RepID=V3ZXH8_LOTGI|nr:hypothetical protein LOTGIDRAFT_154176 [Lottia gigantea]ESO89097.1 hypothetical protein LOTGIDRAFT_154176 [Lottia gigantea]
MSDKKTIWIKIHRLYLTENGPGGSEINKIEINEDESSNDIRNKIISTFVLDNSLILKVRNERNSMVPINKRLQANSHQSPYILEVVKRHQSVNPLSRSVKLDSYNETMKLKLIDIITRMEKLESACPTLKSKREDKIHTELKDIDRKLNFLNKRLSEADDASCSGKQYIDQYSRNTIIKETFVSNLTKTLFTCNGLGSST